jgi:(S)-2-hydroxyglutarate dehydrogenase
MGERLEVGVVGGGVFVLATARSLHRHHPGASVALVEKEPEVGAHQTGHNSGVVHSGIFYSPGSLKARLTQAGRAELLAFCAAERITSQATGKLVLAEDASQVPALDRLFRQATANGVPGVTRLDRAGIDARAPGAAGVAALWVPSTAIVDYLGVAQRLRRRLEEAGVRVSCGVEVVATESRVDGWHLGTSVGGLEAKFVVNCAGLGADLLAQRMGTDPTVSIVPFRGDYYELEGSPRREVHTLVYPVPDPRFPFLGVHLTPTVRGTLLAGPNAALALDREGYRRGAVDPQELLRLAEFPGLWGMLRRYPSMAVHEWLRSWSREEFLTGIRRLWPSVGPGDLGARTSGVRAQAIHPDGTLEDDFVLRSGPNALHVINAPSPAATAAFAIAEHVVRAAGLVGASAG